MPPSVVVPVGGEQAARGGRAGVRAAGARAAAAAGGAGGAAAGGRHRARRVGRARTPGTTVSDFFINSKGIT